MIVKKSDSAVQVDGDLKLLRDIEIWDASYDGDKGNRLVGRLVPMHAPHFAQCKASGAFQANAEGRPFYFTRTPSGIEFHPAADKDYWLEPSFHNAVKRTAGPEGGFQRQ